MSGVLDSDRKGIYGEVTLGGAALKGWQMFPLPLSKDWAMKTPKTRPLSGRPGGNFRGRFRLDHPADTFLDLSKWNKVVIDQVYHAVCDGQTITGQKTSYLCSMN